MPRLVDCVYVTVCARDARQARVCVASIRSFYPDVPIRLLAGDGPQRALLDELRAYWGVDEASVPVGNYGWGMVKLEPLFGPTGETFLVLDADTVMTGPVLNLWSETDAPFLVDAEDLPTGDRKRLYFDWEKLQQVDPTLREPQFLFNSGQWFGTAGLIKRADFAKVLEWSMPRKLRYPDYFMGGDQGVLNYVIAQKVAQRAFHVERRTLMRWPGHSMGGLDTEHVANKTAPACIVHWAGMKKTRMRNMVGADLLLHFEKIHYQRRPAGSIRRLLATSRHVWVQWKHAVAVRVMLRYRKWTRAQT